VRAQAQLGHVGLADHDAAGGLHARGHQAVGGRSQRLPQRRAEGGGETQRVRGVLDGLRDAVQPAHAVAARQHGVALVGLAQQLVVGRQVDDRVGLRVERVHTCQAGLHELAARDLARVDRGAQRVGVEVGEVGRVHWSAFVLRPPV
jgi:hypothetical protein